MPVISVEHLGKAYKRYLSPWVRLRDWINFGGQVNQSIFWVLRNLNFSLQKGQAVAIVGINGAGKSTLLKIIAGVIQPTEGVVKVSGRISSLLELGMGFHNDFTGRQNVLLSGQLMGLTEDQILSLLPEIEEFAAIGHFIDEPVRTYSSGMLVRLAFSLATAVRPEILIVDEALSVGDAAFQQKSFQRIEEFRKAGTTLLLVSHDQNTILSLCDEVILLEGGQISRMGDPKIVLDFYNSQLASHSSILLGESTQLEMLKPSDLDQYVGKVFLCDHQDDASLKTAMMGQLVELQMHIHNAQVGSTLAYEIKNRLGECIFGYQQCITGGDVEGISSASHVTIYRFSFYLNVGPGQYSISVATASDESQLIQKAGWRDLAYCFEVISQGQAHFEGQAWLNAKAKITLLA